MCVFNPLRSPTLDSVVIDTEVFFQVKERTCLNGSGSGKMSTESFLHFQFLRWKESPLSIESEQW